MKGKENDLRIDLKNIILIIYSNCNVGFEIPPSQSWFTDEDWIYKYPDAYEIYKIYGLNPQSYVTKTKIK